MSRKLGPIALVFVLGCLVASLSIGLLGLGSSVSAAPITWEHLSTQTGDIPLANISSQVGTLILDIDRDGYNDFVISAYGAMVWYRFNPAARTWTRYALENSISKIEAGGDFYDIDGDGDLDIVQGSQGGGYIWWWENPYPNYNVSTPWTRYTALSVGTTHHDQIFGDFDGDGKAELAFYSSGMILAEIPADPKGTWSYTNIGASGTEGLAKGDLNGDGKIDLVGGGRWYEHISGSSYTVHAVDTAYGNSRSAVGDLIEGGWPEIVIGSGDTIGPLNLYQWNGSTWVKTTLIASVNHGHSLQVGDINADGHQDIFTAEMYNPGAGINCKSWVLYGNGAGAFTTEVISTGIGNHESKIGDLDGDGDIDILGKDFQQEKRIDLWLNNGTGPTTIPLDNWTYKQVTSSHQRVFGLALGDVTGDGLGDIVSGRYLYRNPGGDMAGSWTQIDLGTPDAQFIVNVDGDSLPDIIAVTNNNLLWLEATTSAGTSWTSRIVGSNAGNNHSISVQAKRLGQIVPGGKPEIVLGDSESYGIKYFEIPSSNPEAGNWPQTLVTSSVNGDGLGVGDIDRDGQVDIVSTNSSGVRWYKNPGNGSANWQGFTIGAAMGGAPDTMDAADLTGDNRLDIIVADEGGGGQLYWFEQPSDPQSPSWTRRLIYNPGIYITCFSVADMDMDGDVDIVSGAHKGTPLETIVWENDGHGNFTKHLIDTGKESHLGAKLGDLDGDGDQDLVSIAWDAYQYVHLWRNDNGGGTLPPTATPVPPTNTPTGPTNTPGPTPTPGPFPTSGLKLWLRSDAGVTLNGSTVSQWADQSGSGTNASQGTSASQPVLVANALNGKPALRFDGSNDYMTFNLPINGLTGMTVFLVSANRASQTAGSSQAEYAAIFWNETTSWGTVYLSPFQSQVAWRFGTTQTNNRQIYTRPSSVGSGYTRTTMKHDGPAGTDTLYVNGVQVQSATGKLSALAGHQDTGNLGRGYNNNTYFNGDIVEVLVYNRTLSDSERQSVEQYLNDKYFGGPSPTNTPVPPTNTPVPPTATPTPGPFPTSGLKLWLEADAGVTLNGSTVSQWADQSGSGTNASQGTSASQPILVANALNGKPALRFDGSNDYMTFNLPINGLTGMTVLLVSSNRASQTAGSSQAEYAAIFWNETTSWGTVYLSPFQSQVAWRFGTTQVYNRQIYTRPSSVGSGYTRTTMKHDGPAGTDTLYVNGVQVQSATGKLSSLTGHQDTGNLGRGYNNNTYFNGDIVEVLVYNRTLSDSERQSVEQYLGTKYNLP